MARSVAVAGAEERHAVLLWKLVSGQGIRVAVIGGSITAAGHLPGGVRHGTGTYGAALLHWLQKVSACWRVAPIVVPCVSEEMEQTVREIAITQAVLELAS